MERKRYFKQARRLRSWGDPITIEERAWEGGPFGYFDPSTGTIAIRKGQAEAAKHVVLIHELLHLVDETLLQAGHTKRRLPHNWITLASGNILGLLVDAGLYPAVSRRQLRRLMTPRRRRAGR